MEDKLKKVEVECESIPILQAQVEVYRADFDAERAAREKIAGEKADLEEELRKAVGKQPHFPLDEQGAGPPPPTVLASVRDRVNHIDDGNVNVG